MELLARTNELPGIPLPNRSRTVLALFDEPLTGETVFGADALSAQTLNELISLSESVLSVVRPLLSKPGQPRRRFLQELVSTAQLTAYAARKTLLGQQIRAGLRGLARTHLRSEDNATEGAHQIEGYIEDLGQMAAELDTLRLEFERLWLTRSRRSEIHISLGYFAGLSARYQAATGWLEEQRQRLLARQAVDAELETYANASYRVLWQTWPD
jgi:hypothetical protein